jgi:NTE family protein
MSEISDSPVDKIRSRHHRRADWAPVEEHVESHADERFAALIRRRQPSPNAVVGVASFGAFLAFLDSTIVNIALPDIQRSFPHYDISALSWVLNAYNIVFAAVLVAAGRLADVLGRRRTFVGGAALFTVASGLCAMAGSVEQLVGFRALQGIGAAILVPASLALVVEAFDAAHRGHAVNLWGAAAALAAGLGPPVGGLLVEWGSWRWVFLVNAPLGVVAVLVAGRVLVESRASGRRQAPDIRGAMLLAVALGLLTLGLVKSPDWGWASAATIAVIAAGGLCFVGFVLSSVYHPVPLVEPAFLQIRSFVVANILVFIAGAGSSCYFLTHVLYLNYVWHYSLLKAGLAIAPAAVVTTVVAAMLGRVADRHGHRIIIVLGALIWAGSLVWYVQRVGLDRDFLGVWLPGQLLEGIGLGATLPLLASAGLAGLAKGASYATASAVGGTARVFGGVIGVALLVILTGDLEHGGVEEALRRGWVVAVYCFGAVATGAVLLGRTRIYEAEVVEPEPQQPAPASPPSLPPRPVVAPVRSVPAVNGEEDLIGKLPLFAGLDGAALAELGQRAEQLELEAGSYLFYAGDASDALYVVRSGRLQVLQQDTVLRELGRGDVIGELGLLVDAPRSASIRAVRDSALVRLGKDQFDWIADRGVLASLVRVLATRLHQAPRPAVSSPTPPEVVVSVIGVDADAPVRPVATALLAELSVWLRAVDPGRIDRDGLERAEHAADKVLLHASVKDADWRDFCLRVADRIVLVAGDPSPPSAPLPARAVGADLVLAGPPASREHRRLWEELITPRSVHAVHYRRISEGLRPLAARVAGRSIGLVLCGGGARGLAHVGVLEELELAGIRVDRIAGTSIGALVGAFAACGLDAAAVDAYMYQIFIRHNPIGDYTLPSKGLIRGRRAVALLREAVGGLLVEQLPKQFRCVSVDLRTRQAVVHRRGPVADVVACSTRLPGFAQPYVYNGRLHVDGGVLDNLPVPALASPDGPVIAVDIRVGDEDHSPDAPIGPPKVPGIGETLMRTMTMGSQAAADAALAQAHVVIRPDTRAVGFLEFHQIDAVREAGRAAARNAVPQIAALLKR